MQFDHRFAARVIAGECDAVAAFGDVEWSLFEKVDPRAVAADKNNRRRTQCLGNILKEFVLSATMADRQGHSLGKGFFSSTEFHDAIMRDESLPLAFVSFSARQLDSMELPATRLLLKLEGAMALHRRELPKMREGLRGPGVILDGSARLGEFPDGTAAWAAALKISLEAAIKIPADQVQTQVPAPPTGDEASEKLLLRKCETPSAFTFPEVSIEVLEPGVALLLTRTQGGLPASDFDAFSKDLGAEPAVLRSFVDSLLEEGILRRY